MPTARTLNMREAAEYLGVKHRTLQAYYLSWSIPLVPGPAEGSMNLAEKLVRYHRQNPENLIRMVFEVIEDNPEARDELTWKINDLIDQLPDDGEEA